MAGGARPRVECGGTADFASVVPWYRNGGDGGGGSLAKNDGKNRGTNLV